MKNITNTAIVLNEMHNLINYSCQHLENNHKAFESLHNAILKKYFKAVEVKIDYDNHTVDLVMNVTEDSINEIAKNYSNTVHVNLNFENIHNFLKSCIEKDEKSVVFYQNILKYYSIHNVIGA
ncbi:hypothetical protein ACG2LH_04035 [Zhouia sp. PK063]|uniref:hypothetical protein n=1 Tax=Zhouia sp. PK063 TaxID=3373602 RepID=UPI0037B51C39